MRRRLRIRRQRESSLHLGPPACAVKIRVPIRPSRQAGHSRLHTRDSRFQILDSRFQIPGFILRTPCSCNPVHCTSHLEVRVLPCGADARCDRSLKIPCTPSRNAVAGRWSLVAQLRTCLAHLPVTPASRHSGYARCRFTRGPARFMSHESWPIKHLEYHPPTSDPSRFLRGISGINCGAREGVLVIQRESIPPPSHTL